MRTHILGFPRIGARRQLKQALESHWRGELSRHDLLAACDVLKREHWRIQQQAGLSFATTGDFSLYDHVLDVSFMLGAIPERFATDEPSLDTYFHMARGDAANNVPAMEMTKWFNTNYHYIVPELSAGQRLSLRSTALFDDARAALDAGFNPKPVLLGPITYLALAKGVDGFDPWDKLPEVLEVYAQVLGRLGTLCDWIQLDEPFLCADLPARGREAFPEACAALNKAAGKARLLLTTYFDALDDNLDLALESGCAGLHLDLVRGRNSLEAALERLPEDMVLSAGLVDGRNVWKTDLGQALATSRRIQDALGSDRLMLGSSCSLLHSPVDLREETGLDAATRSWMAFAAQKCEELGLLGRALAGEDASEELAANARAVQSRRESPLTLDPAVRERCAAVDESMLRRASAYPERRKAQSWLKLPLFPTTTIGSFPQTAEIRAARRRFKAGESSREEYETFLREEIRASVDKQHELGLDVLVHGEPERNDMVEYFGQRLNGFRFTRNGWVQSYGSRCVKPPIIFGDVSRPAPMTVKWIEHAQSLTDKPMKGMLTGPVTILGWSFVRDDLERSEVCRQIALAVRDEVLDLEAAGVRIIQIDEAAFSEGLPIKRRDREDYLRWAVESFRLCSSGVADSTQMHSHMCYSEFNDIIHAIAAMDADVISIESSRSNMELLEAFRSFDYPNEIGPGVYDIHSPRAPSKDEILGLLRKALKFIPKERLWVNPDCGLKTRAWPESLASLHNMVEAARELRREFEG